MGWTIDNSLEDDAIEKFEKTYEGFSIWLKDISIEIKIKIFYSGQNDCYVFETSQYIHTPDQTQRYIPSKNYDEDLAYTLHRAIDSITSFYKMSVKAGNAPTKEWLEENESFCE